MLPRLRRGSTRREPLSHERVGYRRQRWSRSLARSWRPQSAARILSSSCGPVSNRTQKEKVGGKIENVAHDLNVPFGGFLARTGQQPPAGADLTEVGNVYYIRASTEGFKRETVRLKWFTYKTDNNSRLPGQSASVKAERLFKPQAPIDSQIAQVWVSTPSKEGSFFVRFELYSGDVLLAFVDSMPFRSIGAL